MENIFISYKREQREWVAKLVSALERYGYSVWWDPKIDIGEQYSHVINQVIGKVDCILVVWSNDSIVSPWVTSEAMVGFERKNMIPILKEEIIPPVPFNTLQSANLVAWSGDVLDENFQQLLGSIEKYVSLPAQPYQLKVEEKRDEVVVEKVTLLSENSDEQRWKETLKADTKSAYLTYLEHYPHGKHQKKAIKKLRKLASRSLLLLTTFIVGVLILFIVIEKLGE